MAGPEGFEPSIVGSEPTALPLGYGPILVLYTKKEYKDRKSFRSLILFFINNAFFILCMKNFMT